MELRYVFAPLALAAAIFVVSNHSSAVMAQEVTAQDFFAAEARGEFSTSKTKRRAQNVQRQEIQTQQRARIPVPAQTQPVSATRANPFAGVNLGGSWLASNLGASRPAGAPGAWCGYAMRMEMVSQGHGDPGPEFNLVSHWCRVGSPAPVGAIGSIFVSRGHVSKVVAGDCPPGRVATISGNATGRRVSHMCEPISSAVCSRWPGKV
ncbi:MAG: hypothetical protein AB7O79_04280 [Xanthobacteraceae bacterium]